MKEVVDKYGVVWVVSGGNKGPGLFTVGSPPDMPTANMIGENAIMSATRTRPRGYEHVLIVQASERTSLRI